MNIRRPVAGLFLALTVVGGPAALTACGAPGGTSTNDGTTEDDSSNHSGSNPGGVSQGNLPDNHSGVTGSNRDEDSGTNG
jgi:hypothetical protein